MKKETIAIIVSVLVVVSVVGPLGYFVGKGEREIIEVIELGIHMTWYP